MIGRQRLRVGHVQRADRLMAAQLARFAAGQPLENVVKPPA